ncbi:MAG: YhbY family RNA-binding protein [Pseudomonas sp.]|uniref:YhbY family RNA-binding protein n=1 Tax=Pseudomonas sp. TaxID=306 RepID=UPI002353164D|nr:YhbY family RNA-binding protein [Pseudomonas sp.]MBS5841658.1 YhbY family RNA-binding protein [Pseudomonas sp.]
MPLTQEQKKQYKSIGHHLKPVLTIKVNILDRESRLAAIAELCKSGKAELVQVIGKMALLYRKNVNVNKQLSNIHRFK